jgi:hypothetical protein
MRRLLTPAVRTTCCGRHSGSSEAKCTPMRERSAGGAAVRCVVQLEHQYGPTLESPRVARWILHRLAPRRPRREEAAAFVQEVPAPQAPVLEGLGGHRVGEHVVHDFTCARPDLDRADPAISGQLGRNEEVLVVDHPLRRHVELARHGVLGVGFPEQPAVTGERARQRQLGFVAHRLAGGDPAREQLALLREERPIVAPRAARCARVRREPRRHQAVVDHRCQHRRAPRHVPRSAPARTARSRLCGGTRCSGSPSGARCRANR